MSKNLPLGMEYMQSGKKNFGLGKKLLMWLGSFVVIGFSAVYYFGMPIAPLISVGVATLVITLARHFLIKN